MPWLISEAIKIGTASYIGKYENIWSNVHFDDLADLYVLALDKTVAGSFFSLKKVNRKIMKAYLNRLLLSSRWHSLLSF
jgi:hypothetical protein